MIGKANGIRRHLRTSCRFLQPASCTIVSAAELPDPAILNAPLLIYRLETGDIGILRRGGTVQLGFRGRSLT
jgi:hypothetical protein